MIRVPQRRVFSLRWRVNVLTTSGSSSSQFNHNYILINQSPTSVDVIYGRRRIDIAWSCLQGLQKKSMQNICSTCLQPLSNLVTFTFCQPLNCLYINFYLENLALIWFYRTNFDCRPLQCLQVGTPFQTSRHCGESEILWDPGRPGLPDTGFRLLTADNIHVNFCLRTSYKAALLEVHFLLSTSMAFLQIVSALAVLWVSLRFLRRRLYPTVLENVPGPPGESWIAGKFWNLWNYS